MICLAHDVSSEWSFENVLFSYFLIVACGIINIGFDTPILKLTKDGRNEEKFDKENMAAKLLIHKRKLSVRLQ